MNRKQELFQRELDAIRASQEPSARKSFGNYKPIMKHKIGANRTEVLARANVKVFEGQFYYTRERGLTFESREEAIAFAEQVKRERIEECIARAKKHNIEVK